MRNKFAPRAEHKSTALYRVLDVIARLYDTYFVLDDQNIAYAANPLGADVLRQARRDALLLHVRMLIVFFEMSRAERGALASGTDNIIAEDYGFEARVLEIDEATRVRIVDDVGELTYGRLMGAEAEWDLPSMVPPLLKRCYEFMGHAQSEIAKGSALSLRWEFYRKQIGKQLRLA
jgi:hypothetical protein